MHTMRAFFLKCKEKEKYMCYLCMINHTLKNTPKSRSKILRERMLEIKQILREVEDYPKCDYGEETIKSLKEEQYKLSREL